MVQERTETSQQDLQDGDSGLPEFNIQDSTPQEQLEIEAELDIEAGLAPVADEQPAEEPPGEELGAEQGARQTPEPVASEEPPQAVQEEPVPQPRTFSEEEVRRIQAAKDREVAEAHQRELALQQQLDARNLETEVEAAVRRQEAQLAQSVGDAEASRIARDPSNVASIRQNQQAIQENARLKQHQALSEQRSEQQAKSIIAQQLMTRMGLTTDDYNLLMGTADPNTMSSLAQRLASQTLEQRQIKQARQQRVRPETPGAQLSNGHSDGSGTEDPYARIAKIQQKPSWEWTDEEYEFYRRNK